MSSSSRGLLSLAFWLDGEPYWLLVAAFAGIVELVPIIGPIAAGVLAVGVGLTAGWGVAIGAGIAVLVLRQLEDYVIAPRVMGRAVGLSPLVVLVSVIGIGYLLGAAYVLIAIPIAAIASTLIDVVIHDRDPAQEDTPTVLFAKPEERALGLAPAAEDEAAERESQAERADREGADRSGLASGREPLPAAERLLLLVRELLAAALLAQRAARSQAEVEVVEDLRGIFCCHAVQSIASFDCDSQAPPRFRPPRGRARGHARRAKRRSARRRLDPQLVVASGDLSHRGRRDQLDQAAALLRSLGPPVLAVPGNHDIPYTPVRFVRPWVEFEHVWETTEPVASLPGLHVVGLNSARPFRHQGGALDAAQLERAGARLADADDGAVRVAVLHHHLANSPWRAAHKRPVSRRRSVLHTLAAPAPS